MSMQNSTDDKNKVGALVQEMIDNSPYDDEDTEILLHYSDGTWYVTRDHK